MKDTIKSITEWKNPIGLIMLKKRIEPVIEYLTSQLKYLNLTLIAINKQIKKLETKRGKRK